MKYCAMRHPDGWYCVLLEGHDGEHLSIDNAKLWKGTPGSPVWWGPSPKPVASLEEAMLDPTLIQSEAKRNHAVRTGIARGRATGEDVDRAKLMGFTGELCDQCGSPNTIRSGKCLVCTECKFEGSCG